jgi:hypothetical protein
MIADSSRPSAINLSSSIEFSFDQLANIECKSHRACLEFFGNLAHAVPTVHTRYRNRSQSSNLRNQLPDYPIPRLPN